MKINDYGWSNDKRKAALEQHQSQIENEARNTVADAESIHGFADRCAIQKSLSVNNVLLLHSQNPNCTYVAGYNAWKENGRAVNEGEKAIRMMAIASDFNASRPPDERWKNYVSIPVFDISQTHARHRSQETEPPQPDKERVEAVNLKNLEDISPVPIIFGRGINSSFNAIYINPKADTAQACEAIIKGIAFHRLNAFADTPEVMYAMADAAAYIAMKSIGMEPTGTDPRSFGILADHCKDMDSREAIQFLNAVRKPAKAISTELENRIYVTADRDKDKTTADLLSEAVPVPEPNAAMPEMSPQDKFEAIKAGDMQVANSLSVAEIRTLVKTDELWPFDKDELKALVGEQSIDPPAAMFREAVRDNFSALKDRYLAENPAVVPSYIHALTSTRDIAMSCNTLEDVQKAKAAFIETGLVDNRSGRAVSKSEGNLSTHTDFIGKNLVDTLNESSDKFRYAEKCENHQYMDYKRPSSLLEEKAELDRRAEAARKAQEKESSKVFRELFGNDGEELPFGSDAPSDPEPSARESQTESSPTLETETDLDAKPDQEQTTDSEQNPISEQDSAPEQTSAPEQKSAPERESASQQKQTSEKEPIPEEAPDTDQKPEAGQNQSNSQDQGQSPEPESKQETEPSDEPAKASEVNFNPDRKIQDFGNHIGGARKELWKNRNLMVSDLDDMNEREYADNVKKNNIWPTPDYKSIVDSGVPMAVAYTMKLIRDSLPTSPYDGHCNIVGCTKYIGFMSRMRDITMGLKTMDDVQNFRSKLIDNGVIVREPRPHGGFSLCWCDDTSAVDTRRLTKAERHLQYSTERTLTKEAVQKKFLYTAEDKKMESAGYLVFKADRSNIQKEVKVGTDWGTATETRYITSQAPGTANSNNIIYDQLQDGKPSVDEIKDGSFCVAKDYKLEAVNFETRAEATKYVMSALKGEKETAKDPKPSAKGSKESYKPPILKDIERIGDTNFRPEGKHADGDDFMETFGLYGGEFGNWLSDKERQASLDFAYDAMCDIGYALNISGKNIGMNYSDDTESKGLSLAIGSRGKGSALAHYEPARQVINLTKMKGAGSLGHEWIHAMDDFLGGKFGLKGTNTMMSEHLKSNLVPISFKNLMDTIKNYTIPTTGPEKDAYLDNMISERVSQFRHRYTRILSGEQGTLSQPVHDKLEACIREMTDPKAELASGHEKTMAYQDLVDTCQSEGIDTAMLEVFTNVYNSTAKILHKEITERAGSMETPVQVQSKFLKDALALDNMFKKAGHGYWSSDCELLARAGAAYLKDKLAEKGIRDDYLAGHADSSSVSQYSISPQGKEREAINKAFDIFFDDMRERGIFSEFDIDIDKEKNLDTAIEGAVRSGKESNPTHKPIDTEREQIAASIR